MGQNTVREVGIAENLICKFGGSNPEVKKVLVELINLINGNFLLNEKKVLEK
jgi:hypothetical protein